MDREAGLVSIIVPIYNVEAYLRRCVDSLLNQTYKRLEILLIDDGSPDNSPSICDEYAKIDERVRVIHQKNGGVSNARNHGLREAKGEFIAFVDADDWIDERYIQVLLSGFTINEGIDLSICRHSRVGADSFNQQEKVGDWEILSASSLEAKINEMGPYYVWGRLYRYAAIENFFFDEKMIYNEDGYFSLDLISNKKIQSCAYNSTPLYYYFMRESSLIHNWGFTLKLKPNVEHCKTYINREYADKVLAALIYQRVLRDLCQIRYWGSFQTNKDLYKSANKLLRTVARKVWRSRKLSLKERMKLVSCALFPSAYRRYKLNSYAGNKQSEIELKQYYLKNNL